MFRWMGSLIVLLGWAASARADVLIKRVEYRFENNSFVGAVLFDPTVTGRRPGVLFADEQGTASADARNKAAQIARLGYVVFIADLYGKDVAVPKDSKKAAALAGLDEADHAKVRGRADAALKTLHKQSGVDIKQIAAVGFGVGGTAMIELARTGVDLEGVVCVHGPVTAALPGDKAPIQPTFLIIAGEMDEQTPAAQIEAFTSEMKKAKLECKTIVTKGEGHALSETAGKAATKEIDAYLADEIPLKSAGKPVSGVAVMPTKGVSNQAITVLKYVDEHGDAMDGYEGGRTFGNYEHRLATNDKSGKRVKYREWDVNPHRAGVNRGTERLITGSDDTAWYTDDHYNTFKKIR